MLHVLGSEGLRRTVTLLIESQLVPCTEEATLLWRGRDASTAGGTPLRRNRRAAFEAIWLAGEYAAAYKFAGTTLPHADQLKPLVCRGY